MIIYLVRHGETDWNVATKLQGTHDVPLNAKGRQLARVTGAAMRDIAFDLIISSPLSRAIETARLVTSDADIPLKIDDRLHEIDWGIWDGLTRADIAKLGELDNYSKFYENPLAMSAPTGGESVRDVITRCRGFYDDLVANAAYRDKTILVSTHGCALRATINHLFDNPSDFWQGRVPPNCSFTVVENDGARSRLVEIDKIFYDKSLDVNYFKGDS